MNCKQYKFYDVSFLNTTSSGSFKIYADTENKIKSIVSLIMPDYTSIKIAEILETDCKCHVPMEIVDYIYLNIVTDNIDNFSLDIIYPVYQTKYVSPENRSDGVRYNTLDSYSNLLTGKINRSLGTARRLFEVLREYGIYNEEAKTMNVPNNDWNNVGNVYKSQWLGGDNTNVDIERLYATSYAWRHPETWEFLYEEQLEETKSFRGGRTSWFPDYSIDGSSRVTLIDLWDNYTYLEIATAFGTARPKRWLMGHLNFLPHTKYNTVARYNITYNNERWLVITAVFDMEVSDFILNDRYVNTEAGQFNDLPDLLQRDKNKQKHEKILCVRKPKLGE